MKRRVTKKRLETAAAIAAEKGVRVTVGRDGEIVFDPAPANDLAAPSDEALKLEASMEEQMATGRARS